MTESEILNLKPQYLSLSGRGIKCQILVLKQVTHWMMSSGAASHLLMCLMVGRTTVVRSALGWLMLGPQMKTLNQEPNVTTLWVRADEQVRNLLHLRTNDGGLVRTIWANAPNRRSADAHVSTRRNTCPASFAVFLLLHTQASYALRIEHLLNI